MSYVHTKTPILEGASYVCHSVPFKDPHIICRGKNELGNAYHSLEIKTMYLIIFLRCSKDKCDLKKSLSTHEKLLSKICKCCRNKVATKLLNSC